jgi:hypothetical protein
MKFDEFDQYSENMLMAQYEISDIISHELMKGEVREDFLKSTLESCSEPKPLFFKGTISDGTSDAGQLDLILCRPFCNPRRMGSQCLIDKNDALCIIEVKGNCTGQDLKDADNKASTISNLDGNSVPLYGVICYKLALKENTILQRFGLSYDKITDTYYDNARNPNEDESNWSDITYSHLDFFISLEDGKKEFLRKYQLKPGVYRFIRYINPPIMKQVFLMMNSLWREANQPVLTP